MAEQLMTCPLCDGEAYVVDNGHGSYCIECYGCLARTRYYDTKVEAAKAWNTRSERTCRLKMTTVGWSCSACHVVSWTTERKPKPNYCPNCGAKVVSE